MPYATCQLAEYDILGIMRYYIWSAPDEVAPSMRPIRGFFWMPYPRHTYDKVAESSWKYRSNRRSGCLTSGVHSETDIVRYRSRYIGEG